MIEMSYQEILNLKNTDFQLFCGRFLEGEGYIVNFGSMGCGDRDKTRDLRGSKGAIRFVGHCKASGTKKNTRDGLWDDALKAAAIYSSYELPPQEIHLFSHLPLYSLSEKESDYLEDSDKTDDWIRRLGVKLQKEIFAYQNIRPTIIVHHAKSMVDRINKESYAFQKAIRILYRYSRQPGGLSLEEWELFDDDQAREEKEDKEKYRKICDDLKDLSVLPKNAAVNAYDSLLSDIASYVANNPMKAYALSDELKKTELSKRFKQIAVLYLLAVEIEPVPSGLLSDVIHNVIALKQDFADSPLSGARICITRTLRCLLYSGLKEVTQEEYCRVIDDISQISPYWRKFFADLYLRIATGTIIASDLLKTKLGELFNEYLSVYPQCAIAKVSKWILYPIAAASDPDIVAIIEQARTVMKDAKDILDVKWIIRGAFRVLSLQEVDEDGEEDVFSYWGKFIDDLLSNCLPRRLRETSFYLEYLHLRTKISNLIHNLNINDFLMFEKEFIDKKLHLHYWQLRELQINYVGCLYALFKSVQEGLQHVEGHDISRIARGSLLPRGDLSKMPDPRKDALFSFPGIKDYRNNQRMAMPDYPRRYGDVLKWLSNYTIVSLTEDIIVERVSNNQFQYLIFRPARTIKNVRVHLHGSLFRLFERLFREDFPMLPVAAANSLRTFVVLSQDRNISMFLPLVSKALDSPDYEIMLSAHSLWRILYRLVRYTEEGLKGSVSDIIQKAKGRTHPGEGRPRVFWAYEGAIDIKSADNVESDCVTELSRMLRSSIDEYSDKVGKSLTRSAIFRSGIMALLKEWAKKGALIACALKEFPRSAEIWNLLGTALLDTQGEVKTEESLECSAEFYCYSNRS
jgi:hypothetical protein